MGQSLVSPVVLCKIVCHCLRRLTIRFAARRRQHICYGHFRKHPNFTMSTFRRRCNPSSDCCLRGMPCDRKSFLVSSGNPYMFDVGRYVVKKENHKVAIINQFFSSIINNLGVLWFEMVNDCELFYLFLVNIGSLISGVHFLSCMFSGCNIFNSEHD